MGNYQMRQLPSLTALRCLQVRDTQRSVLNIPSSLEALLDVSEVDLSQNGLSRIPDGLFVLPTLRRLNMSNNIMTELHSAIGNTTYSLQQNIHSSDKFNVLFFRLMVQT